MELTRKDIKMTQGLAILTMVSLHLFCRLGTDVYGTPLLWLNSTTPAVYILGWLSEICIPLYSICSGYAHYKLGESGGLSKKRICNRIIKFLIKPLVDALFAYLKKMEPTVPTSGQLRKAYTYILNQEKYLRVFLEDGEVPIDNNASERAIRGFCIGKKNWQMIDTINGAHSSAIIYSIAETARECKIFCVNLLD